MLREGLMTAQEVAAYLRCSVSTVRRFVMRGEIPYYRLGKMVRFRRREVDSWLALYREGELLPDIRSAPVNPGVLAARASSSMSRARGFPRV